MPRSLLLISLVLGAAMAASGQDSLTLWFDEPATKFSPVAAAGQRAHRRDGLRRRGRGTHRAERKLRLVRLARGRRPARRPPGAAGNPPPAAGGQERRGRGSWSTPTSPARARLRPRPRRQRAVRLLPDARQPAAEVSAGDTRRRRQTTGANSISPTAAARVALPAATA